MSDTGCFVRMVEWYQRAFEGRPSPCRFTPSCSSYAREALVVHGNRRGLWLTTRRLVRCRPFGPSGFDPVPEPHHHHLAADADRLADAHHPLDAPTSVPVVLTKDR